MEDLLIANEDESGYRLDVWLTSRFPKYSRTYFQKLIDKGLVLVNGEKAAKRRIVSPNDEIEVEFEITEALHAKPENIPLNILYEDKEMIVINKPAGLVVHPAPGHPNGTFVNGLIYYLNANPTPDPVRPGIVHRLDKETSGVLVAAKTPQSHEKLVNSFANREVKKTYIALLNGNPGIERTIDSPIGRDPKNRQKMAVRSDGKRAITHLKRLSFDGEISVASIDIETGRTHQIRVHMNFVKTPIIGDSIYGSKRVNETYKADRQLLHAYKLSLPHPTTRELMHFCADVPSDIKARCPKDLKL
jgi:23S rRNA pseudouridine1911/1915/1917 synthase